MLRLLAPPVCLVLALLCLVAAFALLIGGTPQPGLDTYRAELAADEQRVEEAGRRLGQRQLGHWLQVGGLFAAGGLLLVSGYVLLCSDPPRRTP